MRIKCKVCGETLDDYKVLEHAIDRHNDKDAKRILFELKRAKETAKNPPFEAVDELGVKWLILPKEHIQRVAVREDLKQIHIWIYGGLIVVDVSKITG
jgi:hypothetical protein